MNAQRYRSLFLALIVGPAIAAAADEPIRLSGDESARTAPFEVGGPWLLDWSTRSDYPELTNFEMRLYQAETGEFVGTIVQLEGTGRGLKMFEDAGSYEIEVVSQALHWELLISEIDPTDAQALKRLSAGERTLEDAARTAARRVPEGGFASWRPVGDDTLLLFSEDESRGFRVTFSPPCPGLSSAEALSFITAPGTDVGRYDSILLENGVRCYFAEIVPTVFD